MTRDEAKGILGEGATEEQVTNLLNNYYTTEKTKNEQITNLQEQLKQYSDYNDIKSKLREIEKANMTEQERLEEQKKEIAKNLSESRIIKNKAKAMEILAGEEIDEDLLLSLVSDDEATTISKANKMKTTLATLRESVAKKTKEDLTTLDVKPTISNVNQNENVMTEDKFLNMSAEEQEKYLSEHPEFE